MWVECEDCILFQEGDCQNFENRDGCYFGVTIEETDDCVK